MSDPIRYEDLTVLRARLGEERASRFWRSLEELGAAEAGAAPASDGHDGHDGRDGRDGGGALADPAGRRRFLQIMGASLALAGLGACTRQPTERIVPYVKPPEQLVPGKPLFFATAAIVAGVAAGVLVESHEGRPTKIEGNPEHPVSRGATDPFAQASVLGLYDPERSQTPTLLGDVRPWGSFVGAAQLVLHARRAARGAGLRLVTGRITSPSLAAAIQALLRELPLAAWHVHEPALGHTRDGARLAFGEDVSPQWRLAAADVILSLDADFLAPWEGDVGLARDFADRRRPDPGIAPSRLYVVESTPSLAGAKADHRLGVRPADVERCARAIAARLGVDLGGGDATPPAGIPAAWLDALVRDLEAHRGRSVVIPGAYQPPAVHALAHAINHALGNAGSTVVYAEPIDLEAPVAPRSLEDLARDIDGGAVEALILLDTNPVYSAPADLRFGERLLRVKQRFHAGLYADETAELCQWHVPLAHPLEAWGDARARDGTVTILQPLLEPLYGSRSPLEILAAFSDRPERRGYEMVRDHYKGVFAADRFEELWRRALHDGVVPGTAARERPVTPRPFGRALEAAPAPPGGVDLVFRPDPTVLDGRFANNAWLQELPKPLTNVTWDNVVWLGPATARRLGVETEDVVEIRRAGRAVKAPVWVKPGQPDDVATVFLGYGRRRGGAVGAGRGYDAYALRTGDAPWIATGAEIVKTGARWELATTQGHHTMEGRPVVREVTYAEYAAHPEIAREVAHEPPPSLTLYPAWSHEGYKWGMSIDLEACIGCNACVVACQAENNVPVVGKDQVARGREMHWLRVDRYYEGDAAAPRTHFQPVPCMHCETAPCEVVCPVNATVHHDEGLNDMVYNRCVGTRYCQNNCPYKVRRFNYFDYRDPGSASLAMLANPDVTVRTRGVMEKCTYCVQRISQGRIQAKLEDRRIADGEVRTACQAACPTRAIVFGDLNDRQSAVSARHAEPRSYALLAELNTRPRTRYLAALANPNPEIEGA